jgi:tetratricopeptide (TPR) repeat protein
VSDSTHPTISDITLALARLADRVAESNALGLEPYVRYTLRRALQELELHIPGLDEPPDLESAQRYAIAAEAALTRGQDREALARALRGLACAPHHPHLFYLAASACFELGAVEDSLRLLYHTLWIHPGHVRARQDLEAITGFLEETEEDEGDIAA